MLYTIQSKKCKPFNGQAGDEINYYWYSALREEDGITIRFGSMREDHEVGETCDLILEKSERIFVDKNKKRKIEIIYKETFAGQNQKQESRPDF